MSQKRFYHDAAVLPYKAGMRMAYLVIFYRKAEQNIEYKLGITSDRP